MNGDLKLSFILKCLREYDAEVAATMAAVMRRRNVGVTGEGARSIAHNESQSGAGGRSNLIFKEYLRMVDMGVGRGNPLGGLRAMRVQLQSRNAQGNVFAAKLRKPVKIYSPIAYGKLTWLQNRLLYGFTEEAIATIKKELEQAQTPVSGS